MLLLVCLFFRLPRACFGGLIGNYYLKVKPFLRTTGIVLDYLLALCFLSGLIICFWGVTGDEMSGWMSYGHWLTGLILGPLMICHSWRFSVVGKFFGKRY
jgi:hypothetical protein